MNRLILTFAAALALICASGCRNSSGASEEAKRPVITVSIEPQRWLLERIVGDKMEVRTLLDRGGNPESYEPAFAHLADLENSALYMQVGNLGFETAIIDKVRANNPDLTIVNTSDSINLIADAHHGHDHGVDPHVWSSAPNALIMARNMLRAVSTLDPDNAGYYADNFTALAARIDSVNAACDSILAPVSGAKFMVWHPSLSYFARDYGLEQIAVGAEGKEHTVADTRATIDHADTTGARVFLVQKDYDSSRAAVIAGEASAIPVETINPLNYHWDEELLHTAGAIAR